MGPLNIRMDLFHLIDLIAIKQGKILGVQSCGQSFSEHRRKLTEEERDASRDWLLAGGKLELWGWRKVKVKRGGKAMVWAPRREEFYLNDFLKPLPSQGGEGTDPPSAARARPGDPDSARDNDGVESARLR